jgi:hypothetical protein
VGPHAADARAGLEVAAQALLGLRVRSGAILRPRGPANGQQSALHVAIAGHGRAKEELGSHWELWSQRGQRVFRAAERREQHFVHSDRILALGIPVAQLQNGHHSQELRPAYLLHGDPCGGGSQQPSAARACPAQPRPRRLPSVRSAIQLHDTVIRSGAGLRWRGRRAAAALR